jgi:hypothetical protein
VDRVVTAQFLAAALRVVAMMCLAPALAAAQGVAAPASAGEDAGRTSRRWIVFGGASTTLLSDCADCEDPVNYRHTASLLGNVGVALNPRTDVGLEVLWVPSTAVTGDRIRSTLVMAALQFRPWRTRGFFLKAGSGMGFVRNWVVDLEGGSDPSPPFTSKAFALGIGTGWEWRGNAPVGLQLLGSQHVVALGDLQTSDRTVENVMGNFWSIGATIVIR